MSRYESLIEQQIRLAGSRASTRPCRATTSQRNPTVPAMDLRMITMELTHAKELLQSVMEELRKKKESGANEGN